MHRTVLAAVRRLAAVGVAAAFFSCAGAPPPTAAAPAKAVPGWISETPAPDARYTYFVGYAEGATDIAAAEAADSSLVAEILRYIGVTISADTTATARATLDTFQADLVQTVKQSSRSRVAGFQIVEKYVAERKNGVTLYILGRYATTDLEAEKRRIAAIFQERIDAVAVPEKEGDELLSEGDAVGAARKFIQAAAAASSSDVENAAIKFERNINKAKDALSRVSFEKRVDRLEAAVGTAFPSPFLAAVKARGRPLAGVPVVVGYQARLANGRLTTRTVSLLSGPDGIVSFDHPAPDFVGAATLTMRLDLSPSLDSLAGADRKYGAMVAALEDEAAAKRVSFSYTVVSAARSKPTAVLIADIVQGAATVPGVAASALMETLSKNGFDVFAAPMEATVAESGDAAVLATARKALAGRAERLAYGTTRIVSAKDDSGRKVATVSAEIKVVELSTGRILYTKVKQVPGVGDSEREAADAARRTLGGKMIGEDLAANLP